MALKLKLEAPAVTDTGAVATSAPNRSSSDRDVTRALADAYDTSADADPDVATVAAAKPLSWDERRKLALDIANLAPPDLPGVLLLAHTFASKDSSSDAKARSAGVTQREFTPPRITQWDATTAHIAPASDAVTSTSNGNGNSSPLQLECGVDLDAAHPELLRRLRAYVDNCYVPHYVPKENCSICEGLWSSGRVIACGNDACDARIHEECFGVVLRETPDGPWLCPSCLLGRQLLCSVCMQYGGALKPLAPPASSSSSTSPSVDDIKWVHTLCAMAIPELVMRDVPSMEPVDGFDEIENGRFRYLCGICRKRGGASIICDFESCNVGMHPFCAGNAGLMVGTESNALAVFCEKHLPVSRVLGAKRLISDEDLVEEIVSESNSVEDDGDGDALDDKFPAANDTQRYTFILASTPCIAQRAKLLGDRATLKWGSSNNSSRSTDLRAKTVESARRPVAAWSMLPDAGGWKTRRPIMFPPPPAGTGAKRRIGIAPFPAPMALVGAIVDLSAKPQDAWVRARVLEYDASKRLHRVQLIATSQAVWTPLSVANALVLYMPHDTNVLDGPRVRLVRAVTHGEALWRPKPRLFEAPTPSS